MKKSEFIPPSKIKCPKSSIFTNNYWVGWCVRSTEQLQTVVWNSRGQHEYLLIYSFKLKSGFASNQLFCHLWIAIHPTAKCLKKRIGSPLYNFNPPTPTLSDIIHSVTDRQTDRQTDDCAKRQSYCVQQYERLKTAVTNGWKNEVDWQNC